MAKAAEKPAAAAAEAKPSVGERIKRLIGGIRTLPDWVRAHQIKAAILGSIVISLFGGLLFTWAVMHAKSLQARREAAYTPADAFAALDEGDLPKALHIAECVTKSGNTTSDDAGGPAYIYGVAALRRADTPLESHRRHAFKVAAHWFHDAFEHGFDHDHVADGLRFYGKSLYFAGRYTEAMPVLRDALTHEPPDAGELSFYLAESALLEPRPDLPTALNAAEKAVADEHLPEAMRLPAQLLVVESLLRLDRLDDAAKQLAALSKEEREKAESLVMEARLDIRAAEKNGDVAAQRPTYEKIVAKLREAQRIDNLAGMPSVRAFYLLGICLRRLDEFDEAHEALHQAYRRAVDSPEGLAARMESGELAQKVEDGEEAIRLYKEVLQEVGDLKTFGSRWLPQVELQRRFVDAYQEFIARKQYEAAARLAESLIRIIDEDQAVQLAAEAYSAWGRSEAPADAGGATYERALSDEARAHFREAGKLYERLAQLRFARREYPEELWTSARFHLLGRDFDAAGRMYRKYLAAQSRVHHAQALVGLAEVEALKGRRDKAFALLRECVELYPRDPAVFRARLATAELYVELNQMVEAEKALTENLEAESLTPLSEEWRRSLFALSRLLYELGRYEEAASRLDEAVERYPEDVEAPEARYRAAEAHRRAAQRIESETPEDALPAERTKFARKAAGEYEAALAGFDRTIEFARKPDARGGLDDATRISMLRNAVFGRGGVLYAMGRYPEAVQSYQNAVSSFPQSPAVIDAYLQIADCYRRMGKPVEMRGTLEQAKLMLDRLPPDAEFGDVSNFSRDQWSRMLDALGS
jgi:tetratricopeptide (TPR) repeat protein